MKMISVLMIYPQQPASFWSIEHGLKFSRQKSLQPPLGLLTVAAMLPDHYEIKLVDLNVTDLDAADIQKADVVFISAMTIHQASFRRVVALCNRLGKTVVAGGPYPSECYNQIEGVDHFILFECENTFKKFLHDFENGSAEKIYRDDSRPDISRTPPPRFDLINVEDYFMMTLQFSRGCPYNCEFCDIIEMYGRKMRTKTPAQFLREMTVVYETGFRGELFIADDNFIGHKAKARDVLREIAAWQKEHGIPFELITQVSIDVAQEDELLDLLVDAGFCRLFIGIETPDINSLKFTGKKQNVRLDLAASVEKVHRKGMMVMGGFIIGFDSDTESIFDMQISFIQKSAIPAAMVGLLKVFPKTQLHRRLLKENRMLESEAFSGDNVDLSINYIPKMPGEKLFAGYRRVIMTLYEPSNFFRRCHGMLSLYPRDYKNKVHLKKGFLLPYINSIFHMTFSWYGVHYIRFMWQIARLNSELLRAASMLTIMGYHFFKSLEQFAVKEKRDSTAVSNIMREY